MVGRTTGRETGLNLGGLYLGPGWSLNYNAGLFDPTNKSIVGSGSIWSPLLTSRVALTIGDPEMRKNKISYVQSYYGRRNGFNVRLNFARQGETELFKSTRLYGANFGELWAVDFSAEYDWLFRRSLARTGLDSHYRSGLLAQGRI